jgi:hypothetical protein
VRRFVGKPMVLVFVLGALALACGTQRTTETFSGTMSQRSSNSQTIGVAADGQLDASVVSITPAVPIGLGVGQLAADGSCAFMSSTSAAVAGTVVSVEVQPGEYCVSVYDVGVLTGSVAFDVAVTHP